MSYPTSILKQQSSFWSTSWWPHNSVTFLGPPRVHIYERDGIFKYKTPVSSCVDTTLFNPERKNKILIALDHYHNDS